MATENAFFARFKKDFKGFMMRYIEQIVENFGESERYCYHNFDTADKSAYSSYVGAVKRYQIKKELMAPSEWKFQKEEQEALTDFDFIAKRLGFNSPQHAYTYYKSGLKHILKVIKKNPKKYATLLEIGKTFKRR